MAMVLNHASIKGKCMVLGGGGKRSVCSYLQN